MPKITHPLWYFDRKCSREHSAVIGVDEAGRGPFAGPVVAAAAYLPQAFYLSASVKRKTKLFNDSKQLKPEQREVFYEQIMEWREVGLLSVEYSAGSVEEIETLNILGATRLCMERSMNALNVSLLPNGGTDPLFDSEFDAQRPPLVLVDGKPLKPFPWEHRGVVKGDAQSLAIAIASIVAKVTRDRMMQDYDREFPQYGFARHKGYGTGEHCKAIMSHGPCKIHRPSFLRKLLAAEEAEPEQSEMGF